MSVPLTVYLTPVEGGTHVLGRTAACLGLSSGPLGTGRHLDASAQGSVPFLLLLWSRHGPQLHAGSFLDTHVFHASVPLSLPPRAPSSLAASTHHCPGSPLRWPPRVPPRLALPSPVLVTGCVSSAPLSPP